MSEAKQADVMSKDESTGYRVGVDSVRVEIVREGHLHHVVRVNGIDVETVNGSREAALDAALLVRRALEAAGLDVDLRRS